MSCCSLCGHKHLWWFGCTDLLQDFLSQELFGIAVGASPLPNPTCGDGLGALLPKGDIHRAYSRQAAGKLDILTKRLLKVDFETFTQRVCWIFHGKFAPTLGAGGRSRGALDLCIFHMKTTQPEPWGKETTSDPDSCLKTSRSS